jgi:hypothetical protein
MDDILTTNRFEGILWSGSQKVIQETRFSYIPDIWVSDSKGKIVYYQFTQIQNK